MYTFWEGTGQGNDFQLTRDFATKCLLPLLVQFNKLKIIERACKKHAKKAGSRCRISEIYFKEIKTNIFLFIY